MAYAGYNVIPFGGYQAPSSGNRTPGFNTQFTTLAPGQSGYNANYDPLKWNPNLSGAMSWLGYSPTQERQQIGGIPYAPPPTQEPTAPTTTPQPTQPNAPGGTDPTSPTTPPGNDYWSTVHPILGGPVGGPGNGSGAPGATTPHSKIPNRLVPGPGPGATPPGTTPTQGPNSDFLGALQTAIDSLGNLAPNINPNPTPSQDYSFNANTPSDNNWSSYVNMLGYNRL